MTDKNKAESSAAATAKKENRIPDPLRPGAESEATRKIKALRENHQAALVQAQETARQAAQKTAQKTVQQQAAAGKMTVSHMLGEIVWLLSQSPAHKHFALSDLEWMVMPPLLLEQYRIFRNGDQPLGVALWAYLSEEAERKLIAGGHRLRPDEWAVGMKLEAEGGGREAGGSSSSPTDGSSPLDDKEGGGREAGGNSSRSGSDGRSPHQQTHAVSKEEGGSLWLVDLICPFHTPENKMADQMLADLMGVNDSGGPFKGKKFKFHHTDPKTGARKVMELGG